MRRLIEVAPRAGIAISGLAAATVFVLFVVLAPDPPLPGRLPLGLLIAFFLLTYGLLISYVYGDARRRGMRHVLWTLVAAFVPNALGFIAYFLLREPLLQSCASCGATARRDFAFCPQCGSPLPRSCPKCHRPVELSWTHCAHCGEKLIERSSSPAAEL